MRFSVNCPLCRIDDWGAFFFTPFVSVALTDSGLLDVECEKGHQSKLVLQQQKFEILFELGMFALLDGYVGSTITSLSAAVERFHEFYAQVLFCSQGGKPEKFDLLWSSVKAQSERQYGAFLFLRGLCVPDRPAEIMDKKPPGMSKTWSGFRNSVAHQGYLPSKSEALAYSELIYNYLQEEIALMQSRLQNALHQVVARSIAKKAAIDVSQKIAFLSHPTMVSLVGTVPRSEPPFATFAAALDQMRGRPRSMDKDSG